ncbi:MAG: DUF4416 family protein [Proteobacteria bacterium]|nr:DUF4416 family protein [Pseudomonadota bacterium]MBU1594383.1 DUF4416 family protein [Pseudomonadota bacterium]
MSTPREPSPGKLVLSVLAAADWWADAWPDFRAGLVERHGPVDYETPLLPFDHTAYYNQELGRPPHGELFRRLLGFARLVPLDGLVAVKLATNTDERGQARPDGSRRVNLDPGLLTLERLILASGKNFTHRVYLGQGIWADLTLIYNRKSGWVALPWTFPDYATEDMKRRLTELRALYKTTSEAAAWAADEGDHQCP